METLTKPIFLIKDNDDINIKDFLEKSLFHFYEELDYFCVRNKNRNFGEWFSESGFLSMFINGIIRHDGPNRKVSAVQEYCVSNHINGGSARCDGFVEDNNNIFLLEAKLQKYSRPVDGNHVDIDMACMGQRKNLDPIRKLFKVRRKIFPSRR